MKKNVTLQIATLAITLVAIFAILPTASGQNIFSGEPVQVVGQFNAYSTVPYNADYRTAVYRRVSVSSGNPVDGRGQWATTITVPGGDVSAVNMTGGGGAGFVFISGPITNRFQNKWSFSGIGQGALDGINGFSSYVVSPATGGVDMGLNMGTTGYYTFVFNDVGYTLISSKFYVGYTSSAPVSINSVGATPNIGGTATINVTTSATPSAEEKIYVRYTTGSDFSGAGSSSLVQVSMAGSSGTATIPGYPVGQTIRYFVFSSTRSLAQLNANSETDRTLAVLRYFDNSGSNLTYVTLPVELTAFSAAQRDRTVVLSWTTATEHNNAYFDIERSADSRTWEKIGTITGNGNTVEQHQYVFTDQKPLSGLNFYRLHQVDFDGSAAVSNILKVNIQTLQPAFSVYPNPVKEDGADIEFSELNAPAFVRLFDIQGRMLREWNFEVDEGTRFHLDLSGLPSGNLFLQVNGTDGMIILR